MVTKGNSKVLILKFSRSNNFSLTISETFENFEGFNSNGRPILSNARNVYTKKNNGCARPGETIYTYVDPMIEANPPAMGHNPLFCYCFIIGIYNNIRSPGYAASMTVEWLPMYLGCRANYSNLRIFSSNAVGETFSSRGSTNYGLVYSNNSSMLPNNSYLGNYWFVNLGAR